MLKKTVTLPSGRVFVIREQNGEDDEVITSYIHSEDNELAILDRFLANLVLSEEIEGSEPVSVPLSTIQDLLVRDKYALLILSRIFSLGETLRFNFKTPNATEEEEYAENLSIYVWDYKKPFPKKGDDYYNPQRIAPYEFSERFLTFTLSSEKVITFDMLTAKAESLLVTEQNTNINQELRVRNLRLRDESGKDQTVNNFSVFSARDMAEIRGLVRKNDPMYPLYTSVDDPITGEEIQIPLLSLPDFFFPTRL